MQEENKETTSHPFQEEKDPKKDWNEHKIIKTLSSIMTIGAVISIIFTLYQQIIRIPSLEEEIHSLKKEIQYLNSTSEVIKLKNQLTKKEKEIIDKERIIELLSSQTKEVNSSKENCFKKIDQLESNINQWNTAYQTCTHELKKTRSNSNLINQINSLRRQIETNNQKINHNSHWNNPNDIQINTWRIDNQNLDSMIKEYQRKLSCHQ